MYAEGQTVKITSTNNNPVKQCVPATMIATIIDMRQNTIQNTVTVKISDADYALIDEKTRKFIKQVVQIVIDPRFAYYDIEIVNDEPKAIEVTLPAYNWADNNMANGKGTTVVAEKALDNGLTLQVTISDYDDEDRYIIEEMVIVNEDNEAVEYPHNIKIKLIGAKGEMPFAFSELWDVITASEAAAIFGLAEATVRQAINRKSIPARKSGGTWLLSRKEAESRWGNK